MSSFGKVPVLQYHYEIVVEITFALILNQMDSISDAKMLGKFAKKFLIIRAFNQQQARFISWNLCGHPRTS